MDPESVLNLFDSFWFHLQIFKKQSKTSNSSTPEQIPENSSKPKFSRQLTIHTRSKSENLLHSNTGSINISSPDSVLKPHLQTILSEREFSAENSETPKLIQPNEGLTKKKKRFSKSLSELEFEEVKGFMDLGFVFSEDDKEDSNLVGIIPGLQRLGHKDEEICGPRARPYLSEAWGVLEEKSPLMNWRVPAVSNEIDMKDNLKWWAHSVASAVR
ncbi:hypothetical protein BUALT_Bualt03G0042600 [Buddleja alternifolia]|uniref:DUF1685 domain-containing protein n=1 Tax=Buddleja alternifolia TaxID=168488 RepID=A0AAV6XXS1_9LAMI|nr:hypothetical protein BUALT_Bualt03G0042600 [Buddleja alternifolia]